MLHPTHEQVDHEAALLVAYAIGIQAAYNGHEDNPYRKGSTEWQEWWLGWRAAYAEIRRERTCCLGQSGMPQREKDYDIQNANL